MSTLLTRVEDTVSALIQHITEHAGVTEHRAKLGLGVVGAAAGGLVLWKLFGGKKYTLPPGPKPWPLIGNLLTFTSDVKIYKLLDRLAKEYGPIYTLYIGPKLNIVVSSSELLREALLRDGLNYTEKPTIQTLEIMTHNGKDMIGATHYDTRVQMQRKLAFAALRNYASGEALEDHLHHAFSIMCQELDRSGEQFSAPSIAYLLSYNMLASMCFGTKFSLDDPWLKDQMDLQKEFEAAFSSPFLLVAAFLPFGRYLPLPMMKSMRRFRDKWTQYLSDNYNKHLAKYNPDDLLDFTDHVIHAMKESEQDPNEHSKLNQLNDDHFKMILFDLFFAGTETTRQTLVWAWIYLAAFPEVQRKAQEEVDNVLGRDGKVTVKSREQLPYVDAVLHEVLRIRPVSSFQLRKTVSDTKLGDYDIPKDTTVWMNTYTLHFNEKEWEDPEAFLPERWLTKNGTYLFQDNGFMPFSIGRRSCIGESFAKLELHMLITMILQRYTLEPLPGRQMSTAIKEAVVIMPTHQPFVARRR